MSRLGLLGGLAACLMLAACGTLERPAVALRAAPLEVLHHADVRARPSDAQSMQSYAEEMSGLLSAERPIRLLALSGGGANGAFGAGVLAGWSRRGDRPVFDVVTGVSTGALSAPYAFLGEDWDDELERAYTEGRASRLVALDNMALLFQPSLFSAAPLRRLVDENVTPEMLAAIAVEHRKGRRLLVATTDLDREETVIWDMGAVAQQGDEASRVLFNEILVASAAIPGVFPPVLIAARDKGQAVYEMHVDGGVNTPFLGIPEALLDWRRPSGQAQGEIYVLVNGVLAQRDQATVGTFGAVLSRSYDSMTKTALRRDLMLTESFARRNGMMLKVTSIPPDWPSSSLDFAPSAMRALFEQAELYGQAGAFGPTLSPSSTPRLEKGVEQ